MNFVSFPFLARIIALKMGIVLDKMGLVNVIVLMVMQENTVNINVLVSLINREFA